MSVDGAKLKGKTIISVAIPSARVAVSSLDGGILPGQTAPQASYFLFIHVEAVGLHPRDGLREEAHILRKQFEMYDVLTFGQALT